MKLLIVDDTAWVHSIIKSYLIQRPDIEVIQAQSGYEAIKLLANGTTPELIILDFNMPKMNGLEFLKLLRDKRRNSLIPVILSTTEPNQGDVATCLKYPATSFLKKPYTWQQLEAELQRHAPTPTQ